MKLKMKMMNADLTSYPGHLIITFGRFIQVYYFNNHYVFDTKFHIPNAETIKTKTFDRAISRKYIKVNREVSEFLGFINTRKKAHE